MARKQVLTSRRFVLRAGLAVGGGLLLDVIRPRARPRRLARHGAPTPVFAPNAFIRIDKTGAVTLIMRDTEVGQGIFTSIAMLIAEELEVGLDQVTVQAGAPRHQAVCQPAAG